MRQQISRDQLQVPYELLNLLFKRHGLEKPDGRMLCQYRCSDEEYADMLSYLQQQSARHQFSSIDSIIFCLYTSEWWRRNYEAGPWKWDGVFASIGLPSDLSRNRIPEMVLPGLKFLQRKILILNGQSRYFATLATEGGLPLKLLSRERDAHLQRFLRSLLREFQVYGVGNSSSYDLASRIGSQLPKTLQHAGLFQICGELVQRIWQLQSNLGETSTPIEDLDRMEPDWRNSFPLVVSDEVAQVLLNSLVKEAVKIARIQEVQFGAHLQKDSTGYHFYRSPKLPSYFSSESLSKILEIPLLALPYRVQLHLSQGGIQKPLLALLTKRKAEDDARYAVETPNELPILTNEAAFDALWLEARYNGITQEIRDLKGAAALSELPWAFVSKEGSDVRLCLIGEGSLKTKHEQVFVAAPLDFKTTVIEGVCEEVCAVTAIKRVLYKVSGNVTFESDEEIVKLSTQADEEGSCQYFISGELFAAGAYGTSIYKGVPRFVRHMETGLPQVISSDRLQWKPRGIKCEWKQVSSQCFGKVTLRYSQNGECLYMANVNIVPSTAAISFEPGKKSGTIILTGFATCDIALDSTTTVTVTAREHQGDSCRITVASVDPQTASIKLHLRWDEDRTLPLIVPFPSRGGRFLGRDGHVLALDENIHIEQVNGNKAQFMSPTDNKAYCLEASVVSNEGIPEALRGQLSIYGINLKQIAPGQHEIDLQVLRESCNLLFSSVDSLDALVRVGISTIDGATVSINRVNIARYDMTLEPDRETGEVFIPEFMIKQFGEAVAGRLTIKAFPLWNPCFEPIVLERNSINRWQFTTDSIEPGPWLITGWDGGWCRLRPLCWTVQESEELEEQQATDEELSFAYVSKIFNVTKRKVLFHQLVDLLAKDPGNPDWSQIDMCISYLDHLPPTTFDIVKRLVKNNDAVCSTLLRANENNFESVWNGLEKLSFAWYLVPVKHWLKASQSRVALLKDALQSALAASPDLSADAIIQDSFKVFANQAPIRMKGLSPLVELIQHKVFNTPLISLTYLRMGSSQAFRPFLVENVLGGDNSALQALLQQHAEDEWPICPVISDEWWPVYGQVVPTELHLLWKRMSFQTAVMNAPVVAAFSACFDLHISKALKFHLRRMREFDPAWFDAYYGCALSLSVGYMIESNKEFRS